jgi:hypothetical protein
MRNVAACTADLMLAHRSARDSTAGAWVLALLGPGTAHQQAGWDDTVRSVKPCQ